jgi:hypothetical protein
VLVGVLGNRTRTAGVEQKMFWQVSRHLNHARSQPVEGRYSADPKVDLVASRGLTPSSHPTALASQVAWITGESQISRPKETIMSYPNERNTVLLRYCLYRLGESPPGLQSGQNTTCDRAAVF